MQQAQYRGTGKRKTSVARVILRPGDGETWFNGKKLDDKMYHRHSGYPGGLRSRPLREELARRPTEVLRKAVRGMLPRTRLGRAQLLKLKIYAGPEHPHEAQAPKPLPLENGNG